MTRCLARHAVRELNVDLAQVVQVSTLNSQKLEKNSKHCQQEASSPQGTGWQPSVQVIQTSPAAGVELYTAPALVTYKEPSFSVSIHQQTGIDDYDIRRGGVGMCDPGAGDYHEDSLPGDIIGAEGG